jgi:two-component system, chemotaxis family, response regulator Rcp1
MSAELGARPFQILLVEDSLEDAQMAQEALKDAKVENELHVVRDGESAMAFVRQEGEFVDAPRPHLVLLDLNLPGKDGREVLSEIKADPDLRRLPVVVMSTSSSEHDIQLAYDLHVNAYVRKPMNLDRLDEIVHAIDEFWFGVVTLPAEVRASR